MRWCSSNKHPLALTGNSSLAVRRSFEAPAERLIKRNVKTRGDPNVGRRCASRDSNTLPSKLKGELMFASSMKCISGRRAFASAMKPKG